ncbi:MAG: MgtC/SapB family protein [Cohnella sp.]|nr:MgtC/SapB family protein [Cohnella sp.]
MQFEYLLRIIAAGLCGALIGFERKNRMKEAGIRTHFIVAVGAALMMVISKYGFQDQIGWNNLTLDPSRIAAQVVSGVGFLGAGMIFMQRHTIKGLTTAAGMWTTAGIGMIIGTGLYIVGLGVTAIILIAQKVLHSQISWLASPKTEQITIRMIDEPGAMDRVQTLLTGKQVAILSFQAEKKPGNPSEIELDLVVKLPASDAIGQLMPLIQELPAVHAARLH